MKKRIFNPISLSFIAIESLIFTLFSVILSVFIWSLCTDNPSELITEYIFCIIAIIFLLYSFFRSCFCFKISLLENYIITKGDGLFKFEKIQYKTVVPYEDISSIKIIGSEKNSKNQNIALPLYTSLEKKYLEFILKDNSKKRMCINYYTKNQIKTMLKYINENMILKNNNTRLNIDEIINGWFKIRKKK